MRKSTTSLLVILLLVIAVGSVILLMGGGGDNDSSDDDDGTDPTDPVDDIINPPPPPDRPPTKGTLRFYVILDGKPVTGATCKADGHTATTSGGYATMELNFGSYTTTVTYGEYSKTKEVYVGSSGAHVEVNWVTNVPPEQGSIKVQTAVDGIQVPGQVEIWQSGAKVVSGSSTTTFTVDAGSYTVKARFESSQTFTGTRTITVRAGEITYVTFSWDSGGMGDLSIFSEGTGMSLGLLLLVAIAILLLSKGKYGLKL